MFPRRADDLLCILVHLRIIVLLLGILVLCLSETTTNPNRIEFVLADTPIQYFPAACFRIKEPFPFLLHDRNWKREIIITHYKSGVIWILLVYLDGVLFLRLGSEGDSPILVHNGIFGCNKIGAFRTQNLFQSGNVKSPHCLEEAIDSLLRCVEFLLFWLRSRS